MKRGRLWFVAVLLFLPSLGAAAGKPMTIDDLMRVRSVSDVRISPDGKRIAYVVSTPSFDTAAHEAILFVVAVSGGAPVRLTYGTRIFNQPLPSPTLRWSPDGSMLTFLAYKGEVPQVMAMSAAGGEAFPLTSVKQGVISYEWAPDSKRIAFLAPDVTSDEEAERKKNKTYFTRFEQEPRISRIWVQEVPGEKPKVLSPAGQTVVDVNWAPDSRSLIFSASKKYGFYAQYNTSIHTVSVEGGEPRTLLSQPGMNRAAQYSPDGKWIAYISSAGYDGMISAKDLFVMAVDGNREAVRKLTDEAWMSQFIWAPDSRSVLFVTAEQTNGGGERMFEQPIMRAHISGGRPEALTAGPVVAYSPSISRDGTQIAYKQVESRTAGDVYVMSVGSRRATRVVEINPELRQFELADLKPISWKSFDGVEIWGLLMTPPGYQPGQKLPLVVYSHGGPIGGFTLGLFPQFMHIAGQVDPYPVEAMAGAGMAILLPMPRGGSGYGVQGFRTILKSWGEIDYKDIMTGVDAMVARGVADPERLGIMGASYGGFMTNWIVTQTSRFKAASAACSLSDLTQMYYLSDGGDFISEYFGLPWEASESLAQHSPITFVRNVNTPLLLQHGELDFRVPISQAKMYYKALRALNKTVELDVYPRGGHVNFEPPLEREYWHRNLQWFTKWLNLGQAAKSEIKTEVLPSK